MVEGFFKTNKKIPCSSLLLFECRQNNHLCSEVSRALEERLVLLRACELYMLSCIKTREGMSQS